MEKLSETIHDAYYRQACREDISFLAPRLRDTDVRELMAATGQSPLEGLESSFDASDLAFTLVAGSEPVCMGGVCPTAFAFIGVGWLLGTDAIVKNAEALQSFMPEFLTALHRLYPCVGNFVDARNMTSLRWLKRFGFRKVGVQESYGAAGLPFFWMMRTDLRNLTDWEGM